MKNNTPRISVNKLAEYIVSKGGRQRQILRDQKFPEDFKGMYYRDATEAITTCILSQLENVSVLERATTRLEQTTTEKIGVQRRINSNIDAIEAFETMLDTVIFHGGSPEAGEHAPEKLKIQNVEISARPEIILRGKGKSGKKLIGAVKLHFPRTFALNADSAAYVSVVVQEYCRSCLVDDEEVFAPYCFVIDVGSKTVYPGAKSTVAKMKDVTAECRNIFGLWPTISSVE